MIITRTPYRISFFGGGTDYPTWYEKHGGAVLSTTIDRYCHVLLRPMPPFLGSKYLVFWSQMEKTNNRDDIKHPGVRGCLEFLDIDENLEVNHAGDLPARAGLGSSSAFTVGMLHALHAFQGRYVDNARLAREAILVEQEVLKETVGLQDQIACAHGGLNRIDIARDGSYDVNPIPLDPVIRLQLEERLMLVFTGKQRYATDIAEDQIKNFARREGELHDIQSMVGEGVRVLTDGGSLDRFGHLLNDAWQIKRELSDKITNTEIDFLYEQARSAGALGGKLLGAGGGGFMLLYVPPSRRFEVGNAMVAEHAVTAPVKFEHAGSQIVHYAP